jgi:hypothetical protein
MKIITVLIVLSLLLVIIGAFVIQFSTHLGPVLLDKPDHQTP